MVATGLLILALVQTSCASPKRWLVASSNSYVFAPRTGDQLKDGVRAIQFTIPFNSLGWPALALPCGAAEDGLPASVQLVGRPGTDALVLAAGQALEAALSLE